MSSGPGDHSSRPHNEPPGHICHSVNWTAHWHSRSPRTQKTSYQLPPANFTKSLLVPSVWLWYTIDILINIWNLIDWRLQIGIFVWVNLPWRHATWLATSNIFYCVLGEATQSQRCLDTFDAFLTCQSYRKAFYEGALVFLCILSFIAISISSPQLFIDLFSLADSNVDSRNEDIWRQSYWKWV